MKKTVKKTIKTKPIAKPKKRAAKLLSSQEPKPYQLFNENGKGQGLLICDHASNRVPKSLNGLGITKKDLNRHIGWDIGTEEMTKTLSRALDMPAVMANYSRLVVDLNRAPDHRECIPAVSDHTVIPANVKMSKKERDQRINEIFWPYQNQIGKQINKSLKKKQVPFIIAVHSLTPEMDGVKRPWHIAILWNKEERIAKRLIGEIRRKHKELLIGENEPYSLKHETFKGSTMWRYGEEMSLPFVFVEFRQDLIDTKAKVAEWSKIFLDALQPVLADYAPIPVRVKKRVA